MPDAATAAYGIEGEVVSPVVLCQMTCFIINSGARKIIKRFISFMLMIKLYEINTISLSRRTAFCVDYTIKRVMLRRRNSYELFKAVFLT